MKKLYLGLGKTIFNTSVTLIRPLADGNPDIEIILSERILRTKYAGNWPNKAIEHFLPELTGNEVSIGESRDVSPIKEYEDALDRSLPFYVMLKKKGLGAFTKKENSAIRTFGHHRAHALGAMSLSPFDDALIVVIDGAGSSNKELQELGDDTNAIPSLVTPEGYEYASTYDLSNGELTCLTKDFLYFTKSNVHQGHSFCNGIGLFYEKISEFIFNSKHEAGKVMGLAPFGKRMPILENYQNFLEALDWNMQFKGKTREEWEKVPYMSLYRDLAATAQAEYEDFLTAYLRDLKRRFPNKKNVILAGGCALNCTANWKAVERNIFENIHVVPNPGDESISLGCAFGMWLEDHKGSWKPYAREKQNSFWGGKNSMPRMSKVADAFSKHQVQIEPDIARRVAQELFDNKIIAWFHGRSECGPRALGHRSILARPDYPDLKNYLNRRIKFRESFRPYGCSVTWEAASEYFKIPEGFENPFMSFAVPINYKHRNLLEHVTHIDGTSRMQTLHKEQEPLFYRLIAEYGKLSGHPILLNTSLNIMGEPVLETLDDCVRFFEMSPVDAIVIGPAYITRKMEKRAEF